MTFSLEITQNAKNDLKAILSFLSENFSREFGENEVNRILEAVPKLRTSPYVYRVFDQGTTEDDSIRTMIISRHLVIFRIDEQNKKLFILRIFSNRMNIRKRFKG